MAYSVQTCSCSDEWMDAQHGKWLRLHTVTCQLEPVKRRARCITCGVEKELSPQAKVDDLGSKRR